MTEVKVRKYTTAEKRLGRTVWTSIFFKGDSNTYRMIKSEKRQERTKRNAKKDRVNRTELQLHKD
jgi:hypothetical protein